MKSLEKIAFFLLPLSALISELTFVPNRILILLCLSWVIFRDKRIINYVSKKKWLILIVVFYLIFILFSNKFLSNEAILLLTIPVYLLLYGSSSLEQFYLKKYFILATVTYSIILIASKTISIASFGFSNFLAKKYWWNEILYKNLTATLHGHPTYIAMFITAAIIMMLNNQASSKKYFTSTQRVLVLTTLLSVLLLLVVKISYLTLGVVMLFYIITLFRKNRRKEAWISLCILILTGIAVFNLSGVKQRLLNDISYFGAKEVQTDDQNRINERAALWQSSTHFIKENPIIGSSFQGRSSKESIYPLAKKLYPPLEYAKNSHNNYLEFGVRYGLPGALVFLFFIFMYLKVGVKNRSFEIIGIAVLICLFSLTESFMFREQGISFVAIFTAILGKQVYGKYI
ncbi:O-antigen ligase family protein [Lutimonas sp.]|uniref:O-antigen ligase family protein n=1 Tax=Lutimonas sp. TaxID=1872403 RepID=UPI003D9B047E